MAPTLQFEPITLGGGWMGTVLTRYEGGTPGDAACHTLPTIEQWHGLLESLVHDPSSVPRYTQLKYSNRGEVFRARLVWAGHSLDVVGRQSRVRGLVGRSVSRLRSPREHRNFTRAAALARAGIDTAIPLAWVACGGFNRRAWLLTEYVPGLVDFEHVALMLLARLDAHRLREAKSAIQGAILDLLGRLERSGRCHRDFKASNLLLRGWDGGVGPLRVVLVDLDGLGRGTWFGASRRWRPLVRLAASLYGYSSITRTDYCRFVRQYLVLRGRRRDAWKTYYRKLVPHVLEYVRRARRRKVGKIDGYTGEAHLEGV